MCEPDSSGRELWEDLEISTTASPRPIQTPTTFIQPPNPDTGNAENQDANNVKELSGSEAGEVRQQMTTRTYTCIKHVDVIVHEPNLCRQKKHK